jgi:hypothetical protein
MMSHFLGRSRKSDSSFMQIMDYTELIKVKGKGKAPCHEGKLGSGDIAPCSLTSALDRGEGSASCPSCFTPGKEPLVPIGEEAGWAPELFWMQ